MLASDPPNAILTTTRATAHDRPARRQRNRPFRARFPCEGQRVSLKARTSATLALLPATRRGDRPIAAANAIRRLFQSGALQPSSFSLCSREEGGSVFADTLCRDSAMPSSRRRIAIVWWRTAEAREVCRSRMNLPWRWKRCRGEPTAALNAVRHAQGEHRIPGENIVRSTSALKVSEDRSGGRISAAHGLA